MLITTLHGAETLWIVSRTFRTNHQILMAPWHFVGNFCELEYCWRSENSTTSYGICQKMVTLRSFSTSQLWWSIILGVWSWLFRKVLRKSIAYHSKSHVFAYEPVVIWHSLWWRTSMFDTLNQSAILATFLRWQRVDEEWQREAWKWGAQFRGKITVITLFRSLSCYSDPIIDQGKYD